MNVTATKYKDAREDNVAEHYTRQYTEHDGLTLLETMFTQSRSDFKDEIRKRISYDNGRTWSEWEVVSRHTDAALNQGQHKLANHIQPRHWNPVHKHYIQFNAQEIWVNGYENATVKYWSGDSREMVMHSFITVQEEDQTLYTEMIRYQDGPEFDPDNWTDPGYLKSNRGYVIGNVIFEPDGDILFTMEIPMRVCCELAGKDIMDIFPSYPDFPNGIVVMRGTWNGEKYIFTPGRPIVISDILSSRGLNEPTMAKLSSGRIVVIMRGANFHNPGWTRTRIDPGTPGVKWYAWSNDNGKTFTDAMPWHFDDGEIVYSSATFSRIIQDERTGKHYWIGNITGHGSGCPGIISDSNFPRYPLNIVELDETYGSARKETCTVIDTRREGEPEWVQLSNFKLLQNRETGNLEVMLTKIGQYSPDKTDPFRAEVWRYEIVPD